MATEENDYLMMKNQEQNARRTVALLKSYTSGVSSGASG